MLPQRLSPRDIGDYRICPRKVWYRRVAHASLGQTNSPTLMLGNVVHSALYLFFGLPLAERQPAQQRLHDCLRSVWKAHRSPGLFPSREAEQACGLKGLDLLSRFADSFSLDVVPVLRERWVQVALGSGVVLFGKADRIDNVTATTRSGGDTPRPEIDVVDYKTGRLTLDEEELADDPAAQIYLLGAQATLRQPVRRVRIAYLAHGAEVRWEPEPEDIEDLRERLTELTARMSEDRTFSAQPGPHCQHCAFAADCPDAGRVQIADLAAAANDVGF